MNNLPEELVLKSNDMIKKLKEFTKKSKEEKIDIKELEKITIGMEELSIEINNHLKYMPGGNGYLEAKEHYNSLTDSNLNLT